MRLTARRSCRAPKPADEETDVGGSEAASTPAQRRHRLAWAVLLARVFQFELSVCDRCGGQVKIVAAVTDPIHSPSSTWTPQPRLPEASTA